MTKWHFLIPVCNLIFLSQMKVLLFEFIHKMSSSVCSVSNRPLFIKDTEWTFCISLRLLIYRIVIKYLFQLCRKCGLIGHFVDVHDIIDGEFRQIIVQTLGVDIYANTSLGDLVQLVSWILKTQTLHNKISEFLYNQTKKSYNHFFV